MCEQCRQNDVVEAADFALLLRTLGEKLEAAMECDRLSYIETMEEAEMVIAALFPVLMTAGPSFARRAAFERRRIVMSN